MLKFIAKHSSNKYFLTILELLQKKKNQFKL